MLSSTRMCHVTNNDGVPCVKCQFQVGVPCGAPSEGAKRCSDATSRARKSQVHDSALSGATAGGGG